MSETKLSSGSQPGLNGWDELTSEPFWGLFNLSGRLRPGYHIGFWAFFVAFHLMYFLPAFSGQELDSKLGASYTVYYLRFIPIFYLSVHLFYQLERRSSGLWLLLLMLAVLMGSMHLITFAMYFSLDRLYGLSQLSPAFEAIGGLYLKPQSHRNGWERLFFIYDIQELQLLVLPVGIKMVQFGLRQQMQQARYEKEALRSELSILKSELEPHFVYNVISSAYAKVLPTSRDAAGYLEKLSQLLKYTLYETNEDWVPLSAEIRSLKRYLQLERLRHGRRLRIIWNHQGGSNTIHKIPTLLMVTLGENAIKHGVRSHSGRSTVRVDIQVDARRLRFSIENDKPVAPNKQRKSSAHGIGLKNIQRRLDLLYPGCHEVLITETRHNYLVTLSIPLQEKP